uniref:Uncharacterized protein n=1 Tax=Glossina austeni TaxID=7395 RepID=A0A1A9UCW4_GLOAU
MGLTMLLASCALVFEFPENGNTFQRHNRTCSVNKKNAMASHGSMAEKNSKKACIKLKKVLGLTVCSNAALDCSSISGLLAYPAGPKSDSNPLLDREEIHEVIVTL